MKERTQKQRNAIEAACTLKLNALDRAANMLLDLEQEHLRGEDWVEIDTQPAAAVGILQKLDMITVIKFNDGVNYAVLHGALL